MFKKIIVLLALPLFGCSLIDNQDSNAGSDIFQDEFFSFPIDGERQDQQSQPQEQGSGEEIISSAELVELQPSVATPNAPTAEVVEVVEAEVIAVKPENIMKRLTIQSDQSLKLRLKTFLESNGFKMIWRTDSDVVFGNKVQYEGKTAIDILKLIAADLSEMGVDIHINVYLKNKVVLVYSVRN